MIIDRKHHSDLGYQPINEEYKTSIVRNDEDYDESVSFFHSFHFMRKFKIEENQKNLKDFPLLVNNEFILGFGSTVPIEEDKNLNDLNNKEMLQTVITRVRQFASNNDNAFKQLFLDNLTSYSQKVGLENSVDIIIPVLSKIADDNYTIKLKFLQISGKFIDFLLSQGEKAYNVIRDDMLKLITEMFNDKNEEDLIKLASSTFIEIARHLNHEDRGIHILSTVIGFANDDSESRVESRSLSCKLFGELAVILGKDYCEQYVIPQLNFLADDPNFKVRKSVALNLVNSAKIVSHAVFTNKIIPMFKNLSADTLWTVRKVCVEVLPKLMIFNKENSNYTSKNDEFKNIFINFILDPQKYVRLAAIESFGQFIYQLEKDELDDQFFNFYKNSLEEYFFNVKEFGIETEMNYYGNIVFNCAYNFPAVLYCYGSSYWPKLKDIYFNLANDINDKVNNTILSSIHEVAKIIGPDLLDSDLLHVYDSFLSQRKEHIRNTAIKNLPKLMSLMSTDSKKKYIKYLQVYNLKAFENLSFRSRSNWRKKVDILEGYRSYSHLFDTDYIWNELIPLCIQFTFDDVSEVRKKSSRTLSKMFKFLIEQNDNDNNEIISKIYKTLTAYAFSQFYRSRIVFIFITKDLIANETIYRQLLKKCFNSLAFDKVTDTRVILSRFFSKIIKKNEFDFILQDEDFLTICKILSQDGKKAVSQYLSNCPYKNKQINISKIQLDNNENFSDSMEYIKTEFKVNFGSNFKVNETKKKRNSNTFVMGEEIQEGINRVDSFNSTNNEEIESQENKKLLNEDEYFI